MNKEINDDTILNPKQVCELFQMKRNLSMQIMGKYFLTIEDVAVWIGVPTGSIQKWVSRGKFPAPIKIAGVVRWRADHLDNFIENQKPYRNCELIPADSDRKAQTVVIPEQLNKLAPYLRKYDTIKTPCVYFLIKNDRVVYIGSSTKLGSCIWSHRDDKDFDDVFFICVDPEKMLDIEANYIRIFQPPLNLAGTLKARPEVEMPHPPF